MCNTGAQLYTNAPTARHRSKAIAARVVVGITMLSSVNGTRAEERASRVASQPFKIAIFDFELQDNSAGGGIIPLDERDLSYLKQSTDEAKRLLSETGRYDVIDTSAVSEHNLASCGRCEGPLAQKLGADQAMIGLITRINRPEFSVQLRVIDAATGEAITNKFTDLRMGANYAWSRGVRWLMQNEILANSSK